MDTNAPQFTPLEESISFYTRNDFAIMNHLLIHNYDDLWAYAMPAYQDNQGILDEYRCGVRTVGSEYEVKWINSLQKRLVDGLNDTTKQIIVENAKRDISNILGAMSPASDDITLFRTAWIDEAACSADQYPYSREYKALELKPDCLVELGIISSFSLTPYRENDNVGSDFYRYEISVRCGQPVLELDQFITHNEDGEVLLPPMKCRVLDIRESEDARCKGIIRLEYLEQLSPDT